MVRSQHLSPCFWRKMTVVAVLTALLLASDPASWLGHGHTVCV